jgi:hypothetical protein
MARERKASSRAVVDRLLRWFKRMEAHVAEIDRALDDPEAMALVTQDEIARAAAAIEKLHAYAKDIENRLVIASERHRRVAERRVKAKLKTKGKA